MLTAQAPYVPKKNARFVAWAMETDLYTLREDAHSRFLGRVRGEKFTPFLFRLSRYCIEQTDTGMHAYSFYWIEKQGLDGAIHSEMPRPDQLTQDDYEEMQFSTVLTRIHHLSVPDESDRHNVQQAIEYGLTHGVRPLIPKAM